MLEYLTKENEINKVLRNQRKTREKIRILFHSPYWDAFSSYVKTNLEKSENAQSGDKIYMLDTFDMPHSYSIFNITNCPSFVVIDSEGVSVIDYPKFILQNLGL